jgi:Protein of unknown function (DUF2786)
LTQKDELARVKARIKALADKTIANGCTEAEAMAAAAMVGRLLERYALSMDEIEVRSARCVQVEVPIGGRRRRPIDACVPDIARFCDCKVWLARAASNEPVDPAQARQASCYIFFGFETDTVLAVYLFEVITRAIATEVTAFKTANPRLAGVRLRRASTSFQHGLVARVAARLEDMHAEREATVQAQQSIVGTALILAKHRVVEEAFAETNIRLVTATTVGTRRDPKAYRDGWIAGDRVNLSRPMTGDEPGRLK